MKTNHAGRFALAGAALTAAACCAGTAYPAAMPQKKPAGSVVVQITNSRAVALKELDATPAGLFIPKVIAGSHAPGKKTSARVATDKDCVFDLRGAYADGSITESPGVDLCKDQNVNLVD